MLLNIFKIKMTTFLSANNSKNQKTFKVKKMMI